MCWIWSVLNAIIWNLSYLNKSLSVSFFCNRLQTQSRIFFQLIFIHCKMKKNKVSANQNHETNKSSIKKSKQDKNRRKSVHFSNKDETYDVDLSEVLAPRRKTLFDSDFSYFSMGTTSLTSSFLNRKSSLLGIRIDFIYLT